MINWKNPVMRANLLGGWLAVLALIGLPLGVAGVAGVPFLTLKTDPMSGVGGYEPFAMEITLMMQTKDNEFIAHRLTSESWKNVGGSQAGARVYARALTAAPQLPSEQWGWVLSEGLNKREGRLATDLKIPGNVSSVALSLKSLTPGKSDTWLLEPTQ